MTDVSQQYQNAEALMNESRDDEAITQLEALLAEREDFSLAHMALSILYGRRSEMDKSLLHGKRACELDPNEQLHYISLSMLHRRAFMVDHDSAHLHAAEDAMNKQRALAMLQQQQSSE